MPLDPLPTDVFARRLRAHRERLGITQADLAHQIAELLGAPVDPSAVSRIEQQTRAVRLDEAVAASMALGVPLILLVSEDPRVEHEKELQEHIAELALARGDWERSRARVDRLSRDIQLMRMEEAALDEALAGPAGQVADPGARILPFLKDQSSGDAPRRGEGGPSGETRPQG